MTAERGFILFIDPEHWYFVPLKEPSNFCLADLRTENLKAATQFRPFFSNKTEILKSLDTLKIIGVAEEMAPYLHTLKITPVEMDYTIDKDKIGESSIFKFSRLIENKDVTFPFNVLPISIHSIKPIKCPTKTPEILK
jgi:hypothetical protein